LIYCGDIADFVRFAGPIGRYLAQHVRRCPVSGKADIATTANSVG